MRKKLSLLAAAVMAVGVAGSVAKADFVLTAFREPDVNLPGYDSVLLFARNTSTGIDVGGDGILVFTSTITDVTSAGLVTGVTRTTKTNANVVSDPDGSHMGTSFSTSAAQGTFPIYGTNSYPSDQSDTGSQLYSWIGNGNANGGSIAASSPAVNTSTTVAANNYGVAMKSYELDAFWTSALSAGATDGAFPSGPTALGTPYDGAGAWVALAVVPHNDVVNFAGTVGGNGPAAALEVYSVTNPTGTVPEPASLGVLTLGGLALLARRRKTA